MNHSNESGFARFMKQIGHIFSLILSRLSKLFDRIVYSPKSSLVVSLATAVVLCVSINFSDLNYRFFNKDDEVLNLTSVPVNALYDTEEYVVEGLPDAVSVTLTGSPADMALYKTQYSVEVTADLRNLAAGENVVELKAGNVPAAISAVINPSSAEVTIDKKQTRTYSIVPELIIGSNQSESDFEVESLSQTSVTIKATKSQLDSIRTVKALIDTSGQNADFSATAILAAYDSSGNKVSVSITPETVDVNVRYVEEDEETENDDTSAENADSSQ
jgi:YbbR domain-containing protein